SFMLGSEPCAFEPLNEAFLDPGLRKIGLPKTPAAPQGFEAMAAESQERFHLSGMKSSEREPFRGREKFLSHLNRGRSIFLGLAVFVVSDGGIKNADDDGGQVSRPAPRSALWVSGNASLESRRLGRFSVSDFIVRHHFPPAKPRRPSYIRCQRTRFRIGARYF